MSHQIRKETSTSRSIRQSRVRAGSQISGPAAGTIRSMLATPGVPNGMPTEESKRKGRDRNTNHTVKSLELQHKHVLVLRHPAITVQKFLSFIPRGHKRATIVVTTACTQNSNANRAHPLNSLLNKSNEP